MQVKFWRFMIATYCSTGFSSSDSCVSISGGSEWEWYVFYVPSPKLERNQTAGTLGSNLHPLGCTHLASFCSLFFGPNLGQTLLGWTTHAQFSLECIFGFFGFVKNCGGLFCDSRQRQWVLLAVRKPVGTVRVAFNQRLARSISAAALRWISPNKIQNLDQQGVQRDVILIPLCSI